MKSQLQSEPCNTKDGDRQEMIKGGGGGGGDRYRIGDRFQVDRRWSVTEHDDEFVSPTKTSGERNAASQGPITNVQDLYDVPIKLSKFSPEELLGLTFLNDVDDGQQVRAKIVKKILDRDTPPPRPTTTPLLVKLQPVHGASPSSTPTSGEATSTGSATAMLSRPLPPTRDPATNSVTGPMNSSCTIGPQFIALWP
eukprot:scaffold2622_cov114-Amphora_coffeaeformis.AAC.1